MGPTQTQVNNAYSGTSLDGDVTINTQGIQEWTVPSDGTYRITAAGAQGGYSGGSGTIMSGVFDLESNNDLFILIGQQGLYGSGDGYSNYGGGGGGGSFVTKGSSYSTSSPLIVAGGGGGNSDNSDGYNAVTSTDATAAVTGGSGGENGNGGGTEKNGGGAGGGFLTIGSSGCGDGGDAFVDGAEGGDECSSDSGGAHGGFGGGGGADRDSNFIGAGGGGGYSGGGGADADGNYGGGGGGSFISSDATSASSSDGSFSDTSSAHVGYSDSVENLNNYNAGHGYVTITQLSSNSAPDSSSNPSPSDGASDVSTSPTLSVDVSDSDGDSLDVTFYDASDDSVIGTDNSVSDGGTASVSWSGLSSNTGYSWYVVADDGSDSTQSLTWSFTTANNPPSASFSITSSSPYYDDEQVSFDASASSDADGSISSYEWDWTNDGSYDDTGVSVSHTFSNAGTYTVNLRVTDDEGQTDSTTQEIEIGEGIVLAEETILNEAEEVSPETNEWSVNISHNVGGTFQWWINTTPDVGSAHGVSSDPYEIGTCKFHGLQPYTTYMVHVTVRGSDHEQNYTFTTGSFTGNSSWYNETYLNVTVESKRPRILWYDFQKCTNETFDGYTAIDGQPWSSRRNSMTETDNDTWYRFIVNVSSDQGWDNIEYINISGWHDNGSDGDTSGTLAGTGGYNRSGNLGANRNFFLKYENVSGTPYFNLTYPVNNTEITIGGFSENNVSDVLGISGQTETRNISFVFKPGYQFRYASGPGDLASWTNDSVNCTSGFPSGPGYDPTTCCWESLDNPWSWNFNITVENGGERWEDDRYRSWVLDEFGIYTYTEIVSVGNAEIRGAPGDRYSTNGSSWYNSNFNSGNSGNVTVCTRSNGNYSMTVNVSDLLHSAVLSGAISDDPLLHLDNTTIWVRGGNRTTSLNFSDSGRSVIWLYGFGSSNGSVDDNTQWQCHEPNGTCKYTGENGSDTGLVEQYPGEYDENNFNSLNPESFSVEFACDIPSGQLAGKYSTHVYYHLRTQLHP